MYRPPRLRQKIRLREQWRVRQSGSRLTHLGRRSGPPDYVGIGVQRCGTTWWHEMLESHPSVAPLGFGAKELHFFNSRWSGSFGQADIDRYHAQFLRRPGQLVGEWTPRYLFDPWAVPLLLRAAPEARLLVLVRDPVARFRSGVKHARAQAQARGMNLGADSVTLSAQRGLYAAQLEAVLRMIPRSQLLVLQFERCVRDTRQMLDKTFDFLGLAPAAVPLAPARNANTTRVELGDELVGSVRARYRVDADRLAGLFPDDIDLELWPETFGEA